MKFSKVLGLDCFKWTDPNQSLRSFSEDKGITSIINILNSSEMIASKTRIAGKWGNLCDLASDVLRQVTEDSSLHIR